MTLTGGQFTMSAGGQSMEGTMSIANDTVENRKVTATENGQATAMEVFHEKDASTQETTLGARRFPTRKFHPCRASPSSAARRQQLDRYAQGGHADRQTKEAPAHRPA